MLLYKLAIINLDGDLQGFMDSRAKRKGVSLRQSWQLQDSRDALDNCKLVDLGCIWYQYIWCNRRMTTGTTKERPDKIVLHKNGFLYFLLQR